MGLCIFQQKFQAGMDQQKLAICSDVQGAP